MLERRAMEAERETVDRYVAAFLADRVGQILRCRITGVQPFGFFATVEELGGDGLVPASTLGNEYFRYDEAAQALIGEQTGETFKMGQKAGAEAGRGQSGVRRASVRASRRQVCRIVGTPPGPHLAARPEARPARQYPPPGQERR